MFSNTKKIMIMASILVGVGVVLFIIGIGIGGLTGNAFGGDYKFESEKLEEFKNVELDADMYDVSFVKGESYKIEYNYLEKYGKPNQVEVIDDTLYFTSHSNKWKNKFFNFDLINLFGNNEKREQQVTVYLPEKANINEVNIELDMGDLELKDLNIKDLSADLNLGDISGEKLVVETSNISLDMGDFEFEDFVSKGLEADMNLGDFDVSGKLEGLTVVNSDMGSININTTLSKESYSYNVDVDMGDVKINRESNMSKVLENNGAPNRIEVNCAMGDVELYFEK